MSGCGRIACCLGLMDEKDFEGIIGVGVLMQRVSSPLSDCGSVFSLEDVGFALNSRSREAKKLKKPWMNLVGSVVLLKNGGIGANGNGGVEHRSSCVMVEFWWLRPWVARVLPENCLNEMSWYVLRKLNGSFKKKEFQDCQKQHSSTVKRDFKICYLADIDSLYLDDNSNNSTSDKGSEYYKGEVEFETSVRESNSVKLECEIRYSCANSESKDHGCDLKAADLWTEARSIAYKISMFKDKSIKHFGYLVPKGEIGWVEAGYYRSLPKDYRKKFKNEKQKRSREHFEDHLEEKARTNACFRFWWHPFTRLILFLYIFMFALIVFYNGVFRLDKILESRFEDLASVDAGLFASLGLLVLLVLLILKIKNGTKTFRFRENMEKSRERRLKEWKDDNK